jgi:type II secretory pathway pseudopilin PulG
MFSWIWGKALLGAGIIAGFLGVLAMSRRDGAKAEQAKQVEATAKAATARARTDDEVRRQGAEAQTEELSKWER